MRPVAGAWSHRVFRLDLGPRSYAVKEMRNPEDDPDWIDWLAEAWTFEQQAIAAGITAAPPGPATPGLARWTGGTLARLHLLDVRPRRRDVFPSVDVANATRWAALVEAADRGTAPWLDLMRRASPCVTAIADLALASRSRPEDEVMTHGDVDQKNIILHASGPHLCDWDVAAPLVPSRELASVALSMAVWEHFDIAREVVRAYRGAGGQVDRIAPEDLGPPLMLGIDWMVLNIERALRLRPVTDAEAATGRGGRASPSRTPAGAPRHRSTDRRAAPHVTRRGPGGRMRR
jgi:hypothetical protein